jgi:transposase InsO family protein
MKYKSDASYTWKTMTACGRSLGYSINRVRIDNDTVFLSKDFTAICAAANIAVERTVPYAHWQLGRIERQW